jgi:hypothetical protein
MFDEMSKSPCVPFISLAVSRALRILETMAGQAILTNHALVLMLHGLYNKWKQPVAYCLINRGTKGEILVNFLMEVLDASHNAGLKVVAIMCDNSVKDLKHMGISEKTAFVRFQNQEIATIFVPPRLLKCTHILFLKHDVANVKCDITVDGKRLISNTNWEAY